MITVNPSMSQAEIQSAVNSSVVDGGTVQFLAGTYFINLLIENCLGVRLIGEGRNTTKIKSPTTEPALRANGIWFSRIQDLQFSSSVASAVVVDIDGSHSGIERGVQGNIFDNVMVVGHETNGAMCDYGLRINRVGGNSAQGSENTFVNCHFYGCKQACCRIDGFNALNNQFYGGNFQLYPKHGVQLSLAHAHFHGVGFQSTKGHEQVDNDGWDIAAFNGGSYAPITITGCRTESWRFLKTSSSNPAVLLGVLQAKAGSPPSGWSKSYNGVDTVNATLIGCHFDTVVVNQQIDALGIPLIKSPYH